MNQLAVRIPTKNCARLARSTGASLRAVFGVSCTGYIGLISVLFVGAIGAAIASTVLLLGVAATRSSFSFVLSHQAMGLANACAEQALERIHSSVAFSGIGTLSLGSGGCNYTVTKLTGQNRTVVASGFVGGVQRKVNISVTTIVPRIVIGSWQEVP